MIDSKCFTTEWIAGKSRELKYNDKNIIEKVVRAMSLLDMLARSGCPFYFKGGTSLMLILGDTAHRLSIDIDIMCPPGTNIEDYLKGYAESGFIEYKLIERKQAGTDIPKSHSKFFYQVAYKGESSEQSFILLDVLYEDCHYMQTQRVAVESPFVETIGEVAYVTVPSTADILGDKLTAFAPETTGIPYYKKDRLATLEIMKQLYDVGRLFEKIDSLEITKSAFRKIAKVELGYRGLDSNLEQVYADIRNTAMNISTRGCLDKEKFDLLQKGIASLKSFTYKGAYYIEQAIIDASRAAYLATLIENDRDEIEKYSGNPLEVADMELSPTLPSKLMKLKKTIPEAYFYWVKVGEMMV